ncbi:hypothetical protein JIQ42_04581 [Leishmania sp. Namibia]|uniref:hypothetical protein n=1 Tax=Leishmania sp. Namibia TaxID=2802991 RepID=UPI001B60B442|nr:hypothetical protein JIQ42_04581 [Leishmania sp. Namibia]
MPSGESMMRGSKTPPPSTSAACVPPVPSTNSYRRPNAGAAKARSARPRKRQQAPFPSIPTLAHTAPHSPAVSRPAAAAPPWLSATSMRGTPAAQRMPSAHYTARNLFDVTRVPRPPDAATWMTRQRSAAGLASSQSAPAAQPTALEAPAYYVVGGAVVNPQLMVSPSVQPEVRGVPSLTVVPDTLRRPGIGPQFNNTHAAAATVGGEAQRSSGSPDNAQVPVGAWGSSCGGASHRTRGRTTSPVCAAPSSVATGTDGAVITVEAIRTGRLRADSVPLLQQALDNTSTASSLGLLRRLYGTTGEDVIEVAHTNPRNGALEPPRLQYHLAQELLPELTGAEAQLKTLASARRRIEWDVSIPTADTLPPPAIAFTTACSGTPVATLNSVSFRVCTNTLVMQRDYATESAAASVGARARPAKPALTQDEENVGLDITREDRIGSSGLYCIHRLVGLRPGLGEQVGLLRVLEYKVVASVKDLFIAPPYINASTGDLFMELNTSLQGTAKLTITGVDCGSVDLVTGDAQKSSNTLTCYLTLEHNMSLSAIKAERDHTFNNTLGADATQYAQVPSAAARLARSIATGSAAGTAASVQRSAPDSSGTEAQGADGFALSLAHFNQETGVSAPATSLGANTGRLSCAPSPRGDGAAAGAPNSTAFQGKQARVGQTRRSSLDVQSVAARNAAAAAAATVGAVAHFTGTENGAAVAISAAYAPATLNSPVAAAIWAAGAAGHSLRAGDDAVGRKTDSRHRTPHHLFPVTNPHELRYECYTEATRLRRLEQRRRLQSLEKAEQEAAAERQCQQQQRRSSVASSCGCLQPAEQSSASFRDRGEKESSGLGAADSNSQSRLTTPLTSEDRKRRKPKAEVLELEQKLHTSGLLSTSAATSWEHCELRSPSLPATFFFMDGLQSPLSYMRLTVWQDRLITLFREEDKDLLRREPRTRFKREALQELSDGGRAGMLANLYLWSGGVGNGSNRRATIHSRRGSSAATSRNFGGGSDSMFCHSSSSARNPLTANGGNAGGGVQLNVSTEAEAEKTFEVLRRLILCLGVEEERASAQLYNDTVQLCSHCCHSALLKTTALTRGTREGLQQAAAAILSNGSPASPRKMWTSAIGPNGNAGLSGKSIELLRSLHDALEVSMTVMLNVGAYGEAVEYALQRVHTLCLLEGDTDALVNAAQRDLAEAYFFYGDYVTAATIAEDVVTLTRELCDDSPDAYEVVEAELLCTLTCVAAGRRERLRHYISNLELNMISLEHDSDSEARATRPLLQAQLRLVLVFAKTYLELSGSVGATSGALAAAKTATTASDGVRRQTSTISSGVSVSTSDAITLLREAVRLLRDKGDLQEMQQNFLMFPIQARPAAPGHSGGTSTSARLPTGGRGWGALTTGRTFANPRRVSGDDGRDAAAKMAAAQKRLRWNLLCFAGAQLFRNDHEQEGIEVMESTLQELVLSQHRHVERNQRATLAAVLWVGLMLAKSRVQPGQVADIVPMLKEMSDRVVRTRGPLHPLAARSNLLYAHVSHYVINSRHCVSLATRSLAALERGVGPQSYDRLMAHYVVGLMAEAQQRWRPAVEHLSTAYAIAQASRLADDDLLLMDTQFLGALLLCPPTAVLDLDTTALCAHFEARLQRLRERVGQHSERLVAPLWNIAELFCLLKDVDSAVEYLQQATRLLDRRGVLLVSTDLLKPADVLMLEQQEAMSSVPLNEGCGCRTSGSWAAQVAEGRRRGEHLVTQRNRLVQASFDTVSQAVHLATALFMWAAMLEWQGHTTEAREKYGQSLALYEASHLGDNSLAAVHIMGALSKLLYTTGACGDALTWARKSEELLRNHYRKGWPLEHAAVRKLIDAAEHRLLVEEGTYVVQSGLPTYSEFAELL